MSIKNTQVYKTRHDRPSLSRLWQHVLTEQRDFEGL